MSPVLHAHRCWLFVACLAMLSGCAPWRSNKLPLENPLAIPASECDVVWDQIVDVVDDDFDIESEQRVRRVGDVLTVGRIDTAPQTGATLIEFWKGDAADFYERFHGTLQTLRRRAVVQVIPSGDTFQVEVVVFKELEDLGMAQFSTAGQATFRSDGSFIRIEEPVGVQPYTLGWIPLGRDAAEEQKILNKIAARLIPTERAGGSSPPMWFTPWLGGEPVPGNGEDATLMKPSGEPIPLFNEAVPRPAYIPGEANP